LTRPRDVPVGYGSPLPDIGPVPQEELNRCPKGCRGRSKKRRPSTPRTECWRGTYVERPRGIVKSRKEQVPCHP
jgi:hypothetical protein